MKVSGNRLAQIGWFCVVAMSLLGTSASAQAQPPERWSRGDGERWQHVGRWRGQRQEARRTLTRSIEFGHLFVSGEYVPSPYEVSYENQQLQINGVAVPVSPDNNVSVDDDEESFDEQTGSGWRRRHSPFPRDVRTIVQGLDSDNVVVVFPGAAPEVLGGDLIFELLAAEDRSRHLDKLLQVLSPAANRDEWTDWLLNDKPSSELVEYAAAWVADRDNSEADNRASINAVRRFDRFAYPLSVLGMIIGAMSVGHLLSYRPAIAETWQETDASPLALRMLRRSVILIVVLSLFDLVWTILASQAGQMRELNPVARYFVHDPVGLIVFKVVATSVGVGLLVALRHYRRAQTATWWLCLVCTLLVFRWLTFSSMYVA